MSTPTASALERLRAALAEFDKPLNVSEASSVAGRIELMRQRRYSHDDFALACTPEAIRTLLYAIDAKDAEIANLKAAYAVQRHGLLNEIAISENKDAEIARLREALTHYVDNDNRLTDRERKHKALAALNAKETP